MEKERQSQPANHADATSITPNIDAVSRHVDALVEKNGSLSVADTQRLMGDLKRAVVLDRPIVARADQDRLNDIAKRITQYRADIIAIDAEIAKCKAEQAKELDDSEQASEGKAGYDD